MNTEPELTTTATDEEAAMGALVTSATEAVEERKKRAYTRKADMERGNQAILDVLAVNEEAALSKAELFAKLSDVDRELVSHNWNLRIAFLEESGQVLTKGNKVAKRYWKVI